MRNVFFLFFALFFFCQPKKFFAQDQSADPVFVPLLAYWNKGDVFNYNITRGKIRYKNGEQTDSTGQRSLQKLTVIDSTSEGYTIRVSGEYSFEWESIGISEMDLTNFFGKYGHLQLEYDIDSNGAFIDFRNLELMRQAFKEMLQLMFQEKKMLREMDGLIQMIATEEYMRHKVFMAYPMLHEFFGNQFAVDSTVMYEQEFPNFADPAKPFFVPVEMRMLQEEDWEGLAVLKKQYEFNEEMCKQMYKGVLQKVPDGQKALDATEGMTMTMSCSADYVFDSFGTVHALYYAHKIFINGELASKEFLEMELVD